jgi:hypothetical protein
MLSRLILLRSAVQKALIDLKEPVQLTDADFSLILEVVSTLEPVECGSRQYNYKRLFSIVLLAACGRCRLYTFITPGCSL